MYYYLLHVSITFLKAVFPPLEVSFYALFPFSLTTLPVKPCQTQLKLRKTKIENIQKPNSTPVTLYSKILNRSTFCSTKFFVILSNYFSSSLSTLLGMVMVDFCV
ncbi:hypothetical protein CLU79DRAFT_782761 [Phycomyces nitens]|nr:hypothetical protein CLU79DRAFT_782761 [Phycomyces nitens]